jgi:hypothetical protein
MRYINYKVLKNIPLLEESVFKHFLDIDTLYSGMSISSPFYTDKNPSFALYYNKGKYSFYDFKLQIHGDCVDLVKRLYKTSFKEAVYIIAKELNLLHLYDTDIIHKLTPLNLTISENKEKKVIAYKYKRKKYTQYELKYWKQFGLISEQLLLDNDIYSPNQILLVTDNNVISTHYDYNYLTSVRTNNKENIPKEFVDKMKKANLCFVYDFNTNYNYYQENKVKIYKPYCKDKWRTTCNKNTVSGLKQLSWDSTKTLVVQKAKKEELCIKSLRPYLDKPIDIISTISETTWIDERTWKLISSYYSKIIIWSDKDETGVKYSRKIANKYNLNIVDYNNISFKNITDQYEYLYHNDTRNCVRETIQTINKMLC